MNKNNVTLSLLLSFSSALCGGSLPSSPVTGNPPASQPLTKVPSSFNSSELPSSFPTIVPRIESQNGASRDLTSPDSLADAAEHDCTQLNIPPHSLPASPIAENPSGAIGRHAEYKRIGKILETYPLLKNLSKGSRIEMFSGMNAEYAQKLIDNSLAIYPRSNTLDLLQFQQIFTHLSIMYKREVDIFSKAFSLIKLVEVSENRLNLLNSMSISSDAMGDAEYLERLSYAESHSNKASQCFYLHAHAAMTQPIEDVRKVFSHA